MRGIGSLRARRVIAIVVSITSAMLWLPPQSARAAVEPEHITELKAGVAAWSMWLGDLGGSGPMTDPLPLTEVDPGTIEGLHLAQTLETAIATPLASAGDQADVGALASTLDGLDTTVPDPQPGLPDEPIDVVVATSDVQDGSTDGFDLDITVTREVGATVALADPDALGGQPFTLTTPDPGAPLVLTFTSTARFRVDDSLTPGPAWLVVDDGAPGAADDTPRASLHGVIDYDFPDGAGGAIGVLDVSIASGSGIDLDVTLLADIADTDADGRLAFFEPASDPSLPDIPGELTLPVDQITTWSRTGSASATATITSSLVTLSGPVALAVPPTDLATADPVAAVTGAQADLDELASFQRVTPFDLLNGLTQYATLLRGAQTHPNADVDLPLVGGRSSDLLNIAKDLSDFIDARITPLENGSGGTPADPNDPDGAIPFALDFTTIGGLADLLEAEDWFDGEATLAYNATADRLTMRIAAAKELDASFVPLPLPADSQVGLAAIGGELNAETGLRGVAPTPNVSPDRSVKTAYSFELPLVIDLAPACTTGDCAADDPDTQGVVEFEDPMPFERFLVDIGANLGAEVSITTLLSVPIRADGQIGFVPVTIGGDGAAASPYVFGQDGTNPTTTIAFDHTKGGVGATPRIGVLLQALTDGDADPSNDIITPATKSGHTTATLKVRAHGADPADSLTDPELGTITIDTTKLVGPYGGDVTLDATALTLKRLDFDTSAPTALLGRFLDTADGVTDALGSISGAAGDDVPFVGESASDLLDELVDLKGAVDGVRTGPTPVDLGDLETKLESALGLSADDLTWDLKDVTGDGNADLIAKLLVDASTTSDLPVRVDLGGVGELTASGLQGSTTAHLDLGIVIPLDGTLPVGAPKVLRSGGFTVTAAIDDGTPDHNADTDVEITGNIGPFEVQLGDAAHPTGRVRVGAQLDVAPTSPDANTAVGIDTYVGALDVNAGAIGGVSSTCAPPDPNAPEDPPATPPSATGTLGCVSVPVFVNGALLSGQPAATPDPSDYLTLEINGLNPTADVNVDLPDNLQSTFDAAALSFDSFDDGLQSIKAILSAAFKASTFGSKLPLVGDDLAAGAKVLQQVNQFLDDPFSFVGVPPSGATVQGFLYDTVRAELATKLSALGILRDSGYQDPTGGSFPAPYYDPNNGTAGAEDIRLVAVCGGSLCAPGDSLVAVTSVTFDVELGQGARNPDTDGCDPGPGTPCAGAADVPLDFGLDGLPVGIDASLSSSAGWTVELGFGISRADGFFLQDNPVPGTGTPDLSGTNDAHDNELRIGAQVSLTQNAGGPEATGKLGFIEVNAEDQHEATDGDPADTHVSGAGISAVIGIAESGGTCEQEPAGTVARNCSKRITAGELVNNGVFGAFTSPVISAEVEVDIQLVTKLDGDVGKLLPKITANFELAWTLSSDSLGNGLAAPEVGFGNVRLDARSLFDNAVGQLIRQLDKLTDPVDPIREFLFAPIPVLSDLSRLFGGGDITMVDLAEIFGDVDLGMLKDIDQFLDFLDTIQQAAQEPIALGDLVLDGGQTQQAKKTFDQVSTLIDQAATSDPTSILATLAGTLPDPTSFNNLNTDDGDSNQEFTFPFLENPSCVFQLMLGGDCGIVEWRPDPMSVHFEYEQSFGPFFGVLYVTLGGYAEATGRLGIGFDTRGIRLLAEDIAAGGTTYSSIPDAFLQSIAILDTYGGQDLDELTVSAGITAGGKLSVIIAEVGVKGGIDATVALNWHDGPNVDGKIYIDEAIAKIATPLCLFDISGRLSAFLQVYAQFGVCPFCVEKSFEIARITLLEFTSSCPDEPPNLADREGDEVVLNVGDGTGGREANRGSGWDTPDKRKESFTVRQLSGPDGSGDYTFSITAFGYTEQETGKSIRVFTAGSEDDSFLFQGVKTGAQNQQDTGTGDGDDADTAPFTAPVQIDDLGTGNDTAKTGDGADVVHGGDDNDGILLGSGDDIGFGDGGSDSVIGDRGTDELHGGADGDTVDGGLGADTAYGDDGHDLVTGGSDNVPIPGQAPTETDGGDHLFGGNGNDTVEGGSGDDFLYGDEELSDDSDGAADTDPDGETDAGADRIIGDNGVDTAYGGGGNDLIIGGFADPSQGNDPAGDFLHGNGGDDEMYGRAGDDQLFGGSGQDSVFGEEGDDQVHGQAGNDPALRGGPGDDTLFGGGGDDTMFGDAGADDMTGDGDGATVVDPATADSVGTDTMDGGADDDVLLGDNGVVDDNPSPRTPHPSETDGVRDVMYGGSGQDQLYGEGGGDDLFGGTGNDLIHGNGGGDNGSGDNGDDEMWGDADGDTYNGGPNDDLVYGNAGHDTLYGQAGQDVLIGGSKATAPDDADDEDDDLYGGTEDDRLYGDNVGVSGSPITSGLVIVVLHGATAGHFGGDTLDGGANEDEGHGQDGTDHLYGGTEADQLFGELGGDFLYGQADPDFLFGDKGTATPAARNITAPPGGWPAGTPAGSPGGVDVIEGGGGDDHAWGGTAGDTLRGGANDDYLEGNDGQDRIFGYAEGSLAADGQDDLIGGSSPVNPLADPAGAHNAPDTGELEMEGNGAQDVMAGDNAIITKVADGAVWATDPVTGGARRTVTLLDTEKSLVALAAVSGNDLMSGNAANDRMFGEGGNDRVKGNDAQDLIEGNQGGDWLEGNNDEDDVIGGSSVANQLDDGDVIHGGGDADVLAGDNALIVRDVPGIDPPFSSYTFTYVTNQIGVDVRRGVVLLDLDAFVAGESGPDQVSGGEGVDVMFGQDDDDFLSGGGADDYQQGNGGSDVLFGDRPLSAVAPPLPAVPPPPAGLPGSASAEPELSGPPQADGQDDQIGGSNFAGMRDVDDRVFGDGQADFQLGDNGELTRTIEGDAYAVYQERYPGDVPPADAVIERIAQRFDVGVPAVQGVWGGDFLYGGDGLDPLISMGAHDGDDSQWGQDGNDELYGEDDNDDQHGELGNDTMYGGAGEDVMAGDRAGIVDRYVDGTAGDPNPTDGSFDVNSPPGIEWIAWAAHPYDRRVSLTNDRDGSVLASPGLTVGGTDKMRGGPGHDSMHGEAGDDYMNGDSGGDYLFGDDGADVMWGGRGNPDDAFRNDPGPNGLYLDIMFGGHGSSNTEAGADIIDYQPRPGVDPPLWFDMTAAYGIEGRQHHHGIDWEYGGWDRDVLQGDVTANGPNDGDKLLDWNGAYNLYTHCNAAYGGWNDVRKLDPGNIAALERLTFALGGGTSLADVQTPGTGGYREAAIVYTKDLKDNSGRAFSSTPGHFEDFICTSD